MKSCRQVYVYCLSAYIVNLLVFIVSNRMFRFTFKQLIEEIIKNFRDNSFIRLKNGCFHSSNIFHLNGPINPKCVSQQT